MPHTHPASPRPRTARNRRPVVAALLALALVGTVGVGAAAAAAGTPSKAAASPAVSSVSAYWVVASDGGVFSFGGAPFYGSTGNIRLNKPMVAITGTSPTDSGGYREVASDGGIFDYGDAHFYGSTGGMQLNRPIVGMSATPDGAGYWLVAADGGVFSFGDAHFYGSTGGMHLNQPIVGMASTGDGRGYWLVAADGGIFAYGDAHFYGSTGNLRLVEPIVAMAPTSSHNGYWLVAADGGIFAFGDAHFYGSLGGVPLSRPVVSMAATSDGKGYWFTNNNGAVTAFGDATYWGSTPQILSKPVVGMVEGRGTGAFTGSSYPSGSYGYDISKYQCSSLPPSPHTIGIVQVEEPGFVNPCLAKEAAWAGGGLNLYVYMNYGTATSSGDPACVSSASPTSCNYGFNAALHSFDDARAAGVDPAVPWWLDIEDSSLYGHQLATQDLIQGAIDALHFAGINSVGIYASPGNWDRIVGEYQPAVPYWAGDWQIAPTTTCANVKSLYPGLPAGPVQMVQYSSPSAPLALGGMSLTYDDDYAC